MEKITLYVPSPEELWFRQTMLSDPETMAYNAHWDVDDDRYHPDTGCIDFPRENWEEWYRDWTNAEPLRYFAYVRREADGAFLGEVNFHYTRDKDWWDMGIVLYAPYRGRGYAGAALRLLLDHAFMDCGVTRVHNEFEISRNEVSAWKAHISAGFHDVETVNGVRHMMITREEYRMSSAEMKKNEKQETEGVP